MDNNQIIGSGSGSQDDSNQAANNSAALDKTNEIIKNEKGYFDPSQPFKDGMTYEEFINKGVIELMGLEDLPKERQEELNKKVERTIQNRTAARVFDALTEQEREEWDGLLQAQNFEEASKYLATREIDYNQWLLEELIIVKYELYEDSKIVREQAKNIQNKQGGTGDVS